jgi:UPF0716 family protein affecting phage T7 exclusion
MNVWPLLGQTIGWILLILLYLTCTVGVLFAGIVGWFQIDELLTRRRTARLRPEDRP